MPVVEFRHGGQEYTINASEEFLSLSREEQRRRLLERIGAQEAAPTTPTMPTQPTEEGEGIWDATKDVVSKGYGAIPEPIQTGLEAAGGGMMSALHQLGRPQSAVAAGLYSLQQQNEGVEAENWKADMERAEKAVPIAQNELHWV